MNVVIDNNIVIDAFSSNPQFEADALRILRLASEDEINGFICANSLTDIFYVVRKMCGAEYAKEKLKGLMSFTNTIPLTEKDCANALELPMNDFEDAVVAVCAKKINADFIVSRDERFIKANTEVKVIAPGQLLAELE
jgi:predicted nucleic acid-binding protein